ncbi:hypothetical protein GPECTOR_8g28 [Gonium pectorale]|uniref:Uncharacterized protein n=1 Tax=Gonium pectorale TaxID=33097 RepID=A0A150GU84_GONPE|nr:hypothetical protein GPECTOR_8g28 [Gonium pectorale]|eukprot:KXZ52900.1 hypothetical protein GPECTOR_8g28 [Gonium pectorale]
MPALRTALESLQARVEDSAVFLRPAPEVATAAREAAKLLYKQAATSLLEGGGASSRAERRALRGSAAAPLPELHTDASFDPEQIWLQLELATEAAVRRVRRLIRGAEPLAAAAGAPGAGLLKPEAAAGIERLLAGGSDESGEGDEEEDEDEEGGSMGEDMEEDEEDEDDEEEERGRRAKRARRDEPAAKAGKAAKQGRLEDQFFRLSDLERYVEDAERRAMAGSEEEEEGDEGEEEGDEDGDAAMFGGDDDEDDEEQRLEALLRDAAKRAGKKAGKKGKGDDEGAKLRYKDFFGGGDDDGEDEEEDEGDEGESDEGVPGGLLSSDGMEDEEGLGEEEEEDDDEDGGAARRRSGKDAGPRDGADAGSGRGKAKSRAEDAVPMSAHERRLARMQERIAELEADALRGKSWHLIGEATAGSRPINSALELDMDFETTAKPVPVQTDEMTNDLEALIRKRIADRRFDDVIRVVPPPLETKKKVLELDDSKSKAGLGELYEQDYVRQVAGGTAEDKDEKLRAEARALFKALSFKLDALSRFHFAPKPVVEDMTVRSEVPAIAMEEAAPVAVSKAAMAAPEEVYRPGTKDGRPQAEGELTREDRKQRRARKKRARKNREEAKDAELRARAVAEGGTADIVGRKSDSKVVSGKGVKVAEGAGASKHGRADVGNSSAVFAKLAAEQAAAAAGGGGGGAKLSRELKKAGGSGGQEGAKKGGAAFKL